MRIAPRSPWVARPMKNSRRAVLDRVAAIFRQMMPFAHAGHDDAASALEQQLHGAFEMPVTRSTSPRMAAPSVQALCGRSSADRSQ